MNNNELMNFWNNNIQRYNILNSLIIFFLSIIVIYQIHYWTDGIVLSSPLLTIVIFSTLFIIFSFNICPWIKFNTDYTRDSRDWRWLIVSLFAGYSTARYYFGIYTQGDFSVHKLWVLQLLNGSVESYPVYKDLPGGVYPFISHAIVAFFTNVSGAYVQHSLIFVLVLLSFLIPLISYKAARQLGFSPALSLFFSSLISLYGGFYFVNDGSRMYQYYLPSIQMFMPYIGRNLSLLVFHLFLILCSKLNRSSKLTYENSINAGILIGLIGLTHHSGFISAILFLLIIFGVNYKAKCLQKEILLNLAIILLTGAMLASLYYVPQMLKIINYGGVDKSTINEVFPTRFFSLYGPLPFLGLYALLKMRDETRTWVLSSFLIIITICLVRFILGLAISIDTWNLFFINYFGPYIFIFVAFLATAGFDNLYRFEKIKNVVIVIMFLIILIGYKTTGDRLKNDLLPQQLDLISGIRKSGTIKTFIANLFPEKGIEKLRFKILNPTDTLIVPADPPDLAFEVASETGLNVSYITDRYFLAFVTFSKKPITQEQRLKMVDVFYNDLTKGILREDILSFFNTNIFLSPSDDLVKKLSQLEKITSVQIIDKEYFLYKL